MSKLTRENGILPFEAAVDLTDKEGSLVVWDSGDLVLASDPLEDVFGTVLVGAPAGEPSSIAIAAGGLGGTVKIRLEGAITAVGTLLMAGATGGAMEATATNKACAMALETGVADEHIEAVLFKPVVI
jgi:hypothetical protein